MIRRLLISLVFIVTSTYFAFAGDACENILKFGAVDSQDTFTDQQNFAMARSVVCRSSIKTLNDARRTEDSLGIDFLDYISFAYGSKVDESNFSNAQEKFCSLSFSEASSSDQLVSRTSPDFSRRLDTERDEKQSVDVFPLTVRNPG